MLTYSLINIIIHFKHILLINNSLFYIHWIVLFLDSLY